MVSTGGREEVVKVSIPHRLHLALLKVQVDGSLGWDEACEEASVILDSNSREYRRKLDLEAQRMYKSRHMKELNKARAKIAEQNRVIGFEEAMETDHFTSPCSQCGKPIHFSYRLSNWETDIKPVLHEAFKTWHHGECAPK